LSSHQTSLSISRETLVLPEREEGETPGRYLERIEANNVDKSVIASYLSKTDDAFLLSVLRSYMRKFAFFGDPIDMAIRKLLMQVELPKETQQIDRVLQGFADRYHECNPGIFLTTGKQPGSN
jgi:Sec7-like guanine-nucleotide exchange factor